MKKLICSLLLMLPFAVQSENAQGQDAPGRPRLTRLSHVAYYTKDLDNTLAFFKDYLGYAEMTRINDRDGKLWIVVIKINDDKFLEIMPEPSADATRLSHFAFETDDVEGMRRYMAAKGFKVPDKCNHDPLLGTTNFFVAAPHGMRYEFVQVDGNGIIAADKGKNLPDARISDVMSHVALTTPDLDEAKAFYEDVLGYNEIWRGGQDGNILWVYDRLPDGEDCIEFNLFANKPSVNSITAMNHICLEVDDVAALHEELLGRPLPEGLRKPGNIVTGSNNIRQMSLYNIDGIRIEIMENHTVDGNPPTAQTGTPLKYIP